ncbi:hypothetical protein PC112_g13499 [Phytophthora cactorum]|nr:hypothetical protein PC112_g13499 [Phytophthora cactorum]
MKLSTLILALVCFAQLGGSSANEATDIMRRQLRVGKAVASLFENQHQSTRELEEKIMQDEDNKPNEVQADATKFRFTKQDSRLIMRVSSAAALAGMAMFLLATPSVAPPPRGHTADKLNLRILEGDMMGQQQRVQSDARILAEDGIEETAGGGWNELLGEKRRTTTKAAGMMAQADDTDDESLLASGRRTRKLASEIRRRT